MTRTRWLPLLLLAAAACEDPGTSSEARAVRGTYFLSSIDERPLPAAEPCSADLIRFEMITLENGTATYTKTSGTPAGQTLTVEGNGTYDAREGEVEVNLTVRSRNNPLQKYPARMVFQYDGGLLKQIVGMPCDGRSVKRFDPGIIN
jgi:hypothetical protein